MSPLQNLFDPQVLAEVGFAGTLILTFGGAVIAIFPRNILYSVLGLALSLTGVAGVFLYLGSPFIALMEILIYVGGICIPIVFAIMLSKPLHLTLPKRHLPKLGLALAAALTVFVILNSIIFKTPWQRAAVTNDDWSITSLGIYLLTRYELVFEVISLVLLAAIMGAIIIAEYSRRSQS
ncbi:MAG: NADH-quinone oxidoreductase subunit J [Deltaproteobacteria bacterium]|nr:NADH-quinone oxidoreductase subunit J [Deltaproteobacteria bacterium]